LTSDGGNFLKITVIKIQKLLLRREIIGPSDHLHLPSLENEVNFLIKKKRKRKEKENEVN
jgi:hypothetical protein